MGSLLRGYKGFIQQVLSIALLQRRLWNQSSDTENLVHGCFNEGLPALSCGILAVYDYVTIAVFAIWFHNVGIWQSQPLFVNAFVLKFYIQLQERGLGFLCSKNRGPKNYQYHVEVSLRYI